MNSKNRSRPERCENCFSIRVIPIVEGHPEGKLRTLELQDKISLRGCFRISEGSPLWACADCGEWVKHEAYCYHATDPGTYQEYNEAVECAFDSFESVELEELRKLNGRRFLRSISRRYLHEGPFELQSSGESFYIKRQNEFMNNLLFTSDRFCQICEWLGGETRNLSIRHNKKEVTVIAAQLAPDRIAVRKE